MSDISQDIESLMLGSGQFKSLIFSDIEFKKDNGRYLIGDCPHCKARGNTRAFHASTEKAVFQCKSGSCQWGGAWHNWLEYDGRSWLEAYQDWARQIGYIWPESSEAAKVAYESRLKRSQLLEDFYALAESSLREDKPVLNYWDSRGYDYETRQKMGLGAYPGAKITQEQLLGLGYSQDEINEAGLVSKGFEYHPALLLLRDKSGAAIGVMGRDITGEQEFKYHYSKGFNKVSMITGLERARASKAAVLIESPLGAAYLNAQGFVMPVIGLGGASLSKEQLSGLLDAKVKRFVLALDNDKAGAKSTERLIEQLQGVGLRSLMVAKWDNGKGLDDSYQSEPAKAERAVLSSVRAAAWQATNLINRSDFGTHIEQEIFFEAAAQQFATFEDGIEREDYRATIEANLGIGRDILNGRFDEAYQRIQEKRTKKQLEEILRASLSSDNPTKAASQAQKQLEQLLRDSRGVTMPEPYLLATAVTDILNSPPGLPLNYGSLKYSTSVQRAALSVVLAESGIGKTTLMLNLLSDWLELPGDERFYFYSYEEPKSHIMLKLVMNWAGVVLGEQNFGEYVKYLKYNRGENQAIESALAKYEQLASSGRLIVDDSMPAVEDLTATLARLGDDTGAVIVDYIQEIPTVEPMGGIRQLQLAHIARELTNAAVEKKIAIFTAAQVNDSGQVREARDIFHRANLVLYFKRVTLAATGEEQHWLKVDKQRSGRRGQETQVFFRGETYKIGEVEA